jgi:hypothetical protein
MPESQYYLTVHCHYYQPPRGNPFNGGPLVEPNADPFSSWNARITAECYQPNGAIGNYKYLSFNVGETLAGWLAQNAPETYHAFTQADQAHVQLYGVGNAVAQPVDHTVLPLSRLDDKVTQVKWGKALFAHRFGRPPTGMWLPEMAVDYETLEVLANHGIEWTILAERQVQGKPPGAGPFWINLPGGKRIKVFIRDEYLSNEIAFSLGHFGGAGRWARQVLVPRKRDAGALTLIATDGETFGHHWPGEEQFLHWLLTYEAKAAGYEVISLERYASIVTPTATVQLRENTAWNCTHGLARWATGCGCTPANSAWKGALRRALDNLRFELDGIYLEMVKSINASLNPFALRDAYINVVLGNCADDEFLKSEGVKGSKADLKRLTHLVQAQFYRQRMYSSSTFFFSELTDLTTQYGLANAVYAIKLTRDATGRDLGNLFRRDLSIAVGPERETGESLTGADLFDQLMTQMV